MELVEREQHLIALTDALRQAAAGKGRIALVSGEAGIGKTTLIERFVEEQRKSARVLRGACDDLFSPQPLGPFIEIAVQIQSDLQQLIRSGVNRLAFSAELFVHLRKSPKPVILILEDLHWADEATLDVVKFLGRRIQAAKTLLILSYRDDEVSSNHPLRFLLGDFTHQNTLRLALPLLSPEAVERLALQADRRLEGLYRATGGNPFFVTEVLAAGEGIPPSVRDAVLARFARLSPAARIIVELASLVPGAIETQLIQAALGPNPSALDECVERGILRPARGSEDGSGRDSVAFRHELARQSVEDSLPIGRARQLHATILAALLRIEGDAASLARLVHHAAGAGDEEAMLRFAPQAVRQASSLSAHREAISLYSTLLRYKHRLALDVQAELFEGLSFELYLTLRMDEAIQARKQASLIWEQLQLWERTGECQRWLSRLYWSKGIKEEAEHYANLAIEILKDHPPGPELAMAYSNMSQLHMLSWEVEPALEWGNRAIALAEKLGAVEIRVHAMTNVGSIEFLLGFDDGSKKIEQAMQIAREHEMHDHVARGYANLGSSSVQFRRYSGAFRWLEEGIEYACARDLDIYTSYLRGWHAQVCFETGRWADAEASATEALHLAQTETITPIPALIALGHLKVRQGDPTALDYLDRARLLSLPTGELQRLGPLAAARAEAAWQRGDFDGVIAETMLAYDLARIRDDPWIFGELAYWRWRAGVAESDINRVAQPYQLMLRGDWQAAASEWQQVGCPYEQALALAEGDAAAQHEALAIFERLGAWPAANWLRERLPDPVGVRPVRVPSRTLDDLTPREVEVMRLVAEGHSNPVIAEMLVISVGTVKAHTASIYSKLGVNNRVQALSRAKELHIL